MVSTSAATAAAHPPASGGRSQSRASSTTAAGSGRGERGRQHAQSNQDQNHGDPEFLTMEQLDEKYKCIGCLGHGGFGSVFLATKRITSPIQISDNLEESTRRLKKVAIKVFRTAQMDSINCTNNNNGTAGANNNGRNSRDNSNEDNNDDDVLTGFEMFSKEIDTILSLEDGSEDATSDHHHHRGSDDNNRTGRQRSIVEIDDWFHGYNFAGIVMKYYSGGTLASCIEKSTEPYTERRICWYALQLCSALTHAHSCGVVHFDVKSSNVLIDLDEGGRLVLSDFGSSTAPGASPGNSFSKEFAAPELLNAVARDDFTGLDTTKIDSFGLGCILFELICCRRIIDFEGEETIGELVGRTNDAGAALDLPQVSLPWVSVGEVGHSFDRAEYSRELRFMIESLLRPMASDRWSPSSLLTALQTDVNSPIMADYCPSQKRPIHRQALTIDNLQLGMFVQRGKDWLDNEADGGAGSVGVVVELDPDSDYTWVAFANKKEPTCCRIGAKNKFELSVGPSPIDDVVEPYADPEQRYGGIILLDDTQIQRCAIGQMFSKNFMVVFVDKKRCRIMIAPVEKKWAASEAFWSGSPFGNETSIGFSMPTFPADSILTTPRKPEKIPEHWSSVLNTLTVTIQDGRRKQMILDLFFARRGGMSRNTCDVVSIEAVESEEIWNNFARYSEQVAMQNWSNPNQKWLFFGTRSRDPRNLIQNQHSFEMALASIRPNVMFSSSSSTVRSSSYSTQTPTTKKIILARVSLGRISTQSNAGAPSRPQDMMLHSTNSDSSTCFTVNCVRQVYPEFIITYRERPSADDRYSRYNVEELRSAMRRSAERERNSLAALAAHGLMSSIAASSTAAPRADPPAPLQVTPAATTTSVKTPSGTKAIKMCVVCMERHVSKILVPCGHTCLCDDCSTTANLTKMKMKCPECRAKISHVVKFFGTIVE